MEKITTEEVMDKLDMFQSRFGKNGRIWMVVFRNNSRRCRYTIYLDILLRRMPNSQSSFDVSGSGTSGNEQKSRNYTENVAYNRTLSYGTCQSFGSVYSVCIDVYNRSHILGSTNKRSDKQRRRSDHAIKSFNWYKTFSITFTPVILSMCCTESYCKCWDKGVKYAPPSAKQVSRYLCWNYAATKRISCVHTQYNY